jgi:hypothetical protein
MADVQYKQYSPEEDRIYSEAITKIREGMQNGLSFEDACNSIDVKDEELKEFILDDALKIMIAEMHYGKAMALEEVAKALNVSMGRISKASLEMIEDAGIAAAKMYNESTKIKADGPAGNA